MAANTSRPTMPKYSKSCEVSRGYEITSPDRSRRKAGQELSDPKPGLAVEKAPAGATVERGTAEEIPVISFPSFVAAEVGAAVGYFQSQDWERVAGEWEQRGYKVEGMDGEIGKIGRAIANAAQRGCNLLYKDGLLRELKHEDKKRKWVMDTSRRHRA